MSSDNVPASAFESLLPKIITVLQLTQNPEGMASLDVKKAILQATNDLKDSLGRAMDLAVALPGGEITIEEQDEVIAMLEETHQKMRQQIEMFSSPTSVFGSTSASIPPQMQSNGTPSHDSAASTPN